MIIDKYVKIKWNPNNKNLYFNLGYNFTKLNDDFEIKIDDLSKGSHIKIRVKCDYCDKEKEIEYRDYIQSINNNDIGKYSCSTKCSLEKMKKSNLKIHGVEYASQSNIIREKIKNTCLKNFNVDNPAKSELIKDKMKETCLKNLGVEYPHQNINIINKTKKTCLDKFGVESPFQNEEIKEKIKNTCLKNLGVEYPMQSELVKEKCKQTILKNYGYEFGIQCPEIKEKIKQTNLKKFGYEFVMQCPEIKEKCIITCIEKYGEAFFHIVPKHNINSIIYLDMISEKINLHILHALNGGEKKFQRYWVDGYIEQYNICIEWNEEYHYKNKKRKEKDIKKYQFLNENLYIIIEINEKEFLKDIDLGIQNISQEILSYIK
jgi:hypothetical protein